MSLYWDDLLLKLYAEQEQQKDFLTKQWIDQHTMKGKEFDSYVKQKLPSEETNALHIPAAMMQGLDVEAHGIHPIHAPAILTHFNYVDIADIHYKSNPIKKEYNFVRPKFYYAYHNDTKKFLSAVVPGKDYVSHHGELLRHLIRILGYDPDERSKVLHYPLVENNIADWTQLDGRFVKHGDRVVMGYVNEMEAPIVEKYRLPKISEEHNEFQGSRRYQTPMGYNLNFLGFASTYWGDSSAKLVTRICELGASEVIYTAKTGVLSSPYDVYTRPFCPSSYINMNRDRVTSTITDLPNVFLRLFPHLNSGAHVSIPTMAEENYLQASIARLLKAQSIDNETAQMALGVQIFNTLRKAMVGFGVMHFGTDYLYREDESRDEQTPNLVEGRTPSVIEKKSIIRGKVADHVGHYLMTIPPNFKNQALELTLR